MVKHGAGALPFHSTKGPSAKVIPATAAIVQNGQSAEIKPAPQKRPNSPSGGSQVSSVGEADSGIGQVSPVHQGSFFIGKSLAIHRGFQTNVVEVFLSFLAKKKTRNRYYFKGV